VRCGPPCGCGAGGSEGAAEEGGGRGEGEKGDEFEAAARRRLSVEEDIFRDATIMDSSMVSRPSAEIGSMPSFVKQPDGRSLDASSSSCVGGCIENSCWQEEHFECLFSPPSRSLLRREGALGIDREVVVCHRRRHERCTYCALPVQPQGEISSVMGQVSRQKRH
jgi:hypothetical protein